MLLMVAGIGDFNGDGISDILWHYNGNGTNVIWKSGNYGTRQSVTTSASGWNVAAIGDYDGDNRSDVLWRKNSTGANLIWRSANSATPQVVRTVTDSNWTVAP
jgi:hypothetical protein